MKHMILSCLAALLATAVFAQDSTSFQSFIITGDNDDDISISDKNFKEEKPLERSNELRDAGAASRLSGVVADFHRFASRAPVSEDGGRTWNNASVVEDYDSVANEISSLASRGHMMEARALLTRYNEYIDDHADNLRQYRDGLARMPGASRHELARGLVNRIDAILAGGMDSNQFEFRGERHSFSELADGTLFVGDVSRVLRDLGATDDVARLCAGDGIVAAAAKSLVDPHVGSRQQADPDKA